MLLLDIIIIITIVIIVTIIIIIIIIAIVIIVTIIIFIAIFIIIIQVYRREGTVLMDKLLTPRFGPAALSSEGVD